MAAGVAALLVVGLRLAVAQPRCRAYGQYQETNMLFRCYGSTVHGDSDSQNRFIVALASQQEKTIAIVPAGTREFRITMKPEHATNVFPGQLLVEDAVSGQNIVRDQLSQVSLPAGHQERKWEATVSNVNGSFKVSYWEHLGHPRSQQVVFHGTTYGPMRIKAKSIESSQQLFRFEKFHYDAYRTGQQSIAGAPMCAHGAMADGCKPYNQVWVRQHAVAFCTDVKNKYKTAEDAWQGMAPDPSSYYIPYYHWEEAWLKVSQDIHNFNGRNMWKVYKFLTHGGFEQDILQVEKEAIEYCYRLEKVHSFAKDACDYFTYHYPSGADELWLKAKELAERRRLEATIDTLNAAAAAAISDAEPAPEAEIPTVVTTTTNAITTAAPVIDLAPLATTTTAVPVIDLAPLATTTATEAVDLCTVRAMQCSGNDLAAAAIDANSAAECCSRCKGAMGCHAWSWNSIGNKQCFLKSGCPNPSPSTSVVSGWEATTTTVAAATTTLQGTLTTYTTEAVPAGSTTLQLTGISGLSIGMPLTISQGVSETRTIASMWINGASGTVTLDSPLQNAYGQGAKVVVNTQAPSTTATVTAVAQGTTVLTAPLSVGQTVAQVQDHTIFDRSDVIMIGGETAKLARFTPEGHLVLALPLQSEHGVGTAVKRIANHKALSPLTAIWDMVKHLPNAPADPADYKDRYLNADGYKGVLPHDLEYCWHPESWTTPKPYEVVTTAPVATTTTRPQPTHCTDHLKKAAFKDDKRIEVEDAYAARFKGATDGGQAGTIITIGGTEEHTIFAVETQSTLLLSERIKTAHAMGTKVQSKFCHMPTPAPTLGPTIVSTSLSTVTTTGLPTSMGCVWKPAPQCAASFSYKGATITGCTAQDMHYDAAWCSDKAVFDGSFHLCEWHCPNPQTCNWKKDEGCVDSFVFQGHPMNACTKFRFHTWWCSRSQVFTGQDDWRYCTWDCGCFWKPDYKCSSLAAWKYKGVVRNGCITDDHASGDGWCSHDKEFSGRWSHCTKYCPEPTDDYGVVPKPTSVSSTQCSWKPVPECQLPFIYNGQSYDQCTKIGHREAWCSTDSTYVGRWAHCKWVCERPADLQCRYEIAPGCLKNFSFGGQVFAGCHVPDEEHNHPWCSEVPSYTSYSSPSKLCNYGCPCFWVPDPDCSMSWTLEGAYSQLSAATTIQGCRATNDGRAWCSTNSSYSGHFRWCAWACMRMNATHGVDVFTNKRDSKLGMYAGIGAGIGAGVSALGLGTYGIVKAVEASQRESSTKDAARMAALQATGSARKLLAVDVDNYVFTPFTSVALIVIVSLCCLVSVLFVLRRRPQSKRYSQDYVEISSE